MTKDKRAKEAAHALSEATGISYTAARRFLGAASAGGEGSTGGNGGGWDSDYYDDDWDEDPDDARPDYWYLDDPETW